MIINYKKGSKRILDITLTLKNWNKSVENLKKKIEKGKKHIESEIFGGIEDKR